MKSISSFVDGKWLVASGRPTPVLDKFGGENVADVYESRPSDVALAIETARRTFDRSSIAIEDRIRILRSAAALVRVRKEELVEVVITECGQTTAEATKEIDRSALTLELTAEETARISGDIIPVEGMAGGAGKFATLRRFPLGVVCAISAFNSPLNTPLHKIAPALAGGNSVVFKPPIVTPIASAILCDILAEAGLPPGWMNYVVGQGNTVGEQLLHDERIDYYHFTGSTKTGKHIASSIGMRRSSLELGCIAPTIVCDDADVTAAATAITRAAYAKAGQVCTSTQLVYAHEGIFDQLLESLSEGARSLECGDPRLPSTQVGPLIAPSEAERVCRWISDAEAGGARRTVGGDRNRSVVRPSVLVDVPEDADLRTKEVFGPVLSVVPIASGKDGIDRHNSGPYGLSVGIFTNDVERAFEAAATLRAGTVHINGASSGRLDPMPFGGVKDSGHGKEGPKYAIEEMMEQRLTVWHNVR